MSDFRMSVQVLSVDKHGNNTNLSFDRVREISVKGGFLYITYSTVSQWKDAKSEMYHPHGPKLEPCEQRAVFSIEDFSYTIRGEV